MRTVAPCLLSVALLAAAPSAAPPGDEVFPAPAVQVPFVTATWGGDSGDIDGDGLRDLVLARFPGVTLSLGQGDGTLGPEMTIAYPGVGPRDVLLRDMDGDGVLDLVLSRDDEDVVGVSVQLGNGDGTFGAQAVSLSTGNPTGLAAADVNGDGALDVLVVDEQEDTVEVRLGHGDGTLAEAVSYASAGRPRRVAVGDVDGDGALDLVTVNEQSDVVRVLTGVGDGSFGAAVSHSVGNGPRALALADLDGDGDLDIATADRLDDTVTVLLGDGAGGFGVGTSHPVVFAVERLVAADLDADGDPDLVASEDDAGLVVLESDGAGGFASAIVVAPAEGAPEVFDVDGTGTPDIVTTAPAPAVHLGRGDLTFAAAASVDVDASVVTGLRGVGLADLDGDGNLDLVTSEWTVAVGAVSVRLGAGDGVTFGEPTTVIIGVPGTRVLALVTEDLSGDGYPDVAVVDDGVNSWVHVLLNDGSGSLGTPTSYTVVNRPNRIRAVDMDGDGDLDLVAASLGWEDVSVLTNAGDGTFAPSADFDAGTLFMESGLAVADVDDDGALDVVVTRQFPARVAVLLGAGDGTLGAPVTSPSLGSTPQVVVVGDFDGDGLDDAVCDLDDDESALAFLKGNGDGTFAAPVEVPGLPNIQEMAAVDIDGDGHLDVVGVTLLCSFVLHGDDSPFSGLTAYAGRGLDLALGDADGDGALDLASVGSPVSLLVTRNLTLDRWADLGHPLPGDVGFPVLTGEGTLAPGSPATVRLRQARASAPVVAVVGPSAVYAPLYGGTLVPTPGNILFGFATDGHGELVAPFTWPAGLPSGFEVVVQTWVVDPAGPFGYAASNGLVAVAP